MKWSYTIACEDKKEEEMNIAKPKLTITSAVTVPKLLDYYAQNRLSRDEFLDALCTKVQWQYQAEEDPYGEDDDWTAPNTWKTLYTAIDQKLTAEDYMFLSQGYEDYQEKNIDY